MSGTRVISPSPVITSMSLLMVLVPPPAAALLNRFLLKTLKCITVNIFYLPTSDCARVSLFSVRSHLKAFVALKTIYHS